LFRISVKHDH